MFKFTKKEMRMMKKLNTPGKVQGFLDGIRINFEGDGKDTVKSPVKVLRTKSAHCIEGAILGAYILSLHGHRPLLVHLKTTDEDYEHVIAPFKIRGLWGALSKSNHATLRYRDPVYKNIRELVMSYFNEYYLEDGSKTLRQYSRPLNLNTFESDWMLKEDDLWGIDEELDKIKHYDIVRKNVRRKLRKADPIERRVLKLTEWQE